MILYYCEQHPAAEEKPPKNHLDGVLEEDFFLILVANFC